MKHYEKPFCETVKFSSSIIASSNCGCWDGVVDWGAGENCTGDTPACTCGENYNPAIANCITPNN